jgi:hypothetical protein
MEMKELGKRTYILGTAREDANNTTNLIIATNNRVKLTSFGIGNEVVTVLGEGFVRILGGLAVHLAVAANVLDGLLQLGLVQSVFVENGGNIVVVVKNGKDVINGQV